MELIDKDALVAEIERLVSNGKLKCQQSQENNDQVSYTAWSEHIATCGKILSFLDTLEAKEVDFENSMVCKVDWYDGFLLDYTQEQQDELLEKIGANIGDKIRVILIKE